MTIHFWWGDDDFTIAQKINHLKKDYLDTNWLQFNFHKFSGDKPEVMDEVLIEVMTPPFGCGDRLVLLENTTIGQQCSEELLTQLQRTLTQIPTTTHLIFTSAKKPNGRLKSTKLINQHAQVQEFSLIPPWQSEALISQVQKIAQEKGVTLTKDACDILATSVGNNSLLLWQEMEKLSVYQNNNKQPLDRKDIQSLVNVSSQNSLQLAEAILSGNVGNALQLAQDLINMNEPALRIVATLVGQFRMWTIVKTAIESGESDEKKIAQMADICNPKRLYFIKKQIIRKSAQQLRGSLPILLELESSLKFGADPLNTLQSKIIELCSL